MNSMFNFDYNYIDWPIHDLLRRPPTPPPNRKKAQSQEEKQNRSQSRQSIFYKILGVILQFYYKGSIEFTPNAWVVCFLLNYLGGPQFFDS